MWVVIFAILVTVIALVQIPLRRVLQRKIGATAEYVFWRLWGDQPQTYWRDETSKSVERNTQARSDKISTLDCGATQYINSDSLSGTQVSAGVEKGAEAQLDTFNIQ